MEYPKKLNFTHFSLPSSCFVSISLTESLTKTELRKAKPSQILRRFLKFTREY